VQVRGTPSEVTMHHLEAREVITSAGSACQAKKKSVSPGLLAIGLTPEDARGVLRFSFGWTTTEGEVDHAVLALGEVIRELAGARS
jgi:cysteine desulfurase